jgi:hypothetical protein
LFDLDGTLCDYDKAMKSDMQCLRAPNEPLYAGVPHDDAPQYLQNRANLIRTSEDWWANLEQFKLGFDIWNLTKQIGYRHVILTQGPRLNSAAWSGKKRWINENLGSETDVVITRDKGLVYGKVLVDDWPRYIIKWLKWRPRGLVIMPAQKHNLGFKNPQVIRYTGKNLSVVSKALEQKYDIAMDYGLKEKKNV